jgi:hypothetical protein
MNKSDIVAGLQTFRGRLQTDVAQAFGQRGSSFGNERFFAWRRQFGKFLDDNLPGMSSRLEEKLRKSVYYRSRSESDMDVFLREDGEPAVAFIDSLVIDVTNGEFDFSPHPIKAAKAAPVKQQANAKRVFIVHGHNELVKTKTARFIEKLGFETVILHEQASKGMTIIEKIEANTDVAFAIILYTPDDRGNAAEPASKGELSPRARQNVVFEHGYLIAKLGRARVVPLVSGGVELPSDISGVVYVDDANWQIEIAKEMKGAGYVVDFNKIVEN